MNIELAQLDRLARHKAYTVTALIEELAASVERRTVASRQKRSRHTTTGRLQRKRLCDLGPTGALSIRTLICACGGRHVAYYWVIGGRAIRGKASRRAGLFIFPDRYGHDARTVSIVDALIWIETAGLRLWTVRNREGRALAADRMATAFAPPGRGERPSVTAVGIPLRGLVIAPSGGTFRRQGPDTRSTKLGLAFPRTLAFRGRPIIETHRLAMLGNRDFEAFRA